MNWENYWNSVVSSDQGVFEQVQRTTSGAALNADQMIAYVQYLRRVLNISEASNSNKRLLDLCCGNGWITNQLSTSYKQCLGLDFSHDLIRYAEDQFGSDTTSFHKTKVSELLNYTNDINYDHVVWLFSLQYFSANDFKSILSKLNKILSEDGKILLGDIPVSYTHLTLPTTSRV